jgi:hypothetical protein
MHVLLPPVGRGITSPCFADGANDFDGWACLWHGVTFEHHQVLPWVVTGEGISVNEAVYTGRVGLDGRRRWCEVNIVAIGWRCSVPNGNAVISCAGGVAARP